MRRNNPVLKAARREDLGVASAEGLLAVRCRTANGSRLLLTNFSRETKAARSSLADNRPCRLLLRSDLAHAGLHMLGCLREVPGETSFIIAEG